MLVLIILGWLIASIGGIWLLIRAFKVSVLWGLACIFIPFAYLFWLIQHWESGKHPFFVQILGIVLFFLGYFGQIFSAPDVTIAPPEQVQVFVEEKAETISSAEPISRDYTDRGRIQNEAGQVYLKRNDLETALERFSRYMELEPNNPNSHCMYGECLMRMGRHKESIVKFRTALELNPHWPQALFMLGEAYKARYDTANALKYYRRYIGLYPKGEYIACIKSSIDSLEAFN